MNILENTIKIEEIQDKKRIAMKKESNHGKFFNVLMRRYYGGGKMS